MGYRFDNALTPLIVTVQGLISAVRGVAPE